MNTEAQALASEIKEAKAEWSLLKIAAQDGVDDDESLDAWDAFVALWKV